MILPEHATHGHNEAAAHSACAMHACDFCAPRAPRENRAYFSRASAERAGDSGNELAQRAHENTPKRHWHGGKSPPIKGPTHLRCID